MADPVSKSTQPAEDDGLTLISARLGKIGAIATTLVALSSALFACSADNIKRNDSFLAAVHSQEKQWQELYSQYFAALAANGDKEDQKLLDKKLLAICNFSNREIPAFKEHKLGLIWFIDDEGRQNKANEQLNNLKRDLRSALFTDGSSTTQSSECIAEQKDTKKANESLKQDRGQENNSTNAPPAVTEPQLKITEAAVTSSQNLLRNAPENDPVRRSLTLTSGAKNGYDIDIFWCEGPNDSEIFQRGKLVADRLAQNAETKKLASQFSIGRIRLRPLSRENQASDGYPSSGFEVRREEGEREVGLALAEQLNQYAIPPGKQISFGSFTLKQTTNETKWYLSAFVCS